MLIILLLKMKIINEQYKDKCLYSDFRITSICDRIVSIEYGEDGGFIIKMKSNHPSLFNFTTLKKA